MRPSRQPACKLRGVERHEAPTRSFLSPFSFTHCYRVRAFSKLRTVLVVWLALLSIQPTLAQDLPLAGAASAPAGQQPLLDAAPNGVPIVHIAPPSAAGVSRNQYDHFNVNRDGLILNNSSGNVQSQLGGWVGGNLQLGSTPARLILNEVISQHPSQLRGYLEVAGRRADIVIANPNGLSCDGCGFINSAGRVTLSTGAPQLNTDGMLERLDVQRGQLSIGGAGLNATDVEQLDLIARGLVIEGEIWARNVNAVLGANQVLYGTLQATPQNGDGSAPRFAVDVKDLGGMYANTIHLVATEEGLGVNSRGRMAALQGNLTLSANGDLTLKDSYAAQNINIGTTRNATLTGLSVSDADTTLRAGGAIAQRGRLDTQGRLALYAGAIENSGELIQRADGDLTLTAQGRLDNSGRVYSGGALRATAREFNDSGGEFQATGELNLHAQGITLQGSRLTSDGNVVLAADAGSLSSAGVHAQAAGDIELNAHERIENLNGHWQAGEAMRLAGKTLNNQGGNLASSGRLQVDTHGQTRNEGGEMLAGSDVQITAGTLSNDLGGLIAANAAARLTTTDGELSNRGGRIEAQGELVLDAGGATLNNHGGTLISDGAVTIASGSLANRSGHIESAQALTLAATGEIDNTQGALQSVTAASVQAGTFTNHGGRLIARDGLTIVTETLRNDRPSEGSRGGTLAATAGAVNISAQTTRNGGGRISATSGIVLDTHDLDNRGGEISSAAELRLDTHGGQFLNRNGALLAEGDADITAGEITNRDGAKISARNLTLDADSLHNDAAQLSTALAMTLDLGSGTLTNQGGKITAGRAIDVSAEALNNRGGDIIAAERLSAAVTQLDNHNGVLSATHQLTLASRDAIDNTEGLIVGDGSVKLIGSTLDNRLGTLSGAHTSIDLGSGSLNNSAGHISGAQSLVLTQGEMHNADGVVSSGATLTLDTQGSDLDNRRGIIVSKDGLALNSAQLLNSGGTLAAIAGDVTLAADGALINDQGARLQAGRDLNLRAGATHNDSGLISGRDIDLNLDILTNDGGAVVAGAQLRVGTHTLDNDNGLLMAVGDGRIDTHDHALINTHSGDSGGIISGGALTIRGGSLDNRAGVITSRGQQSLTLDSNLDNRDGGALVSHADAVLRAATLYNSTGQIGAVGDLEVAAASELNNRGGRLIANGTTTLTSANLDNSAAGSIDAQRVAVTASELNNSGGQLRAVDSATLNAAALNNRGGELNALGTLDVNAATLDNSDGAIVSDLAVAVTTNSEVPGGTVASSDSVTLNIDGDYTNDGLLSAQQTLTVNADTITNTGTLTAGDTLSASSGGDLINQGEISATNAVILVAGGTLTNQGEAIINSVDTRINAATLNNSGKIYGDQLRVQADLITNRADGAIAARDHGYIGAREFGNTEDGDVTSLGDLFIAGGFDEADVAQGAMERFLNASSHIEVAGHLTINAATLLNRNDHLVIETVTDDPVQREEIEVGATRYPLSLCAGIGGNQDNNSCIVHPELYGQRSTVTSVRTLICSRGCETTINYGWDDPVFERFDVTSVSGAPPSEPRGGCTGRRSNATPCTQWRQDYAFWDAEFQVALDQLEVEIDAWNAQVNEENRREAFEDYRWHRSTTVTTRDKVISTDPAELLAGGDITLTGAVTNANSHIIAGGSLSVTGPEVNNIELEGKKTIVETRHYLDTWVKSCGRFGNKHCRQWQPNGRDLTRDEWLAFSQSGKDAETLWRAATPEELTSTTSIDLEIVRYECNAQSLLSDPACKQSAGDSTAIIKDDIINAAADTRRAVSAESAMPASRELTDEKVTAQLASAHTAPSVTSGPPTVHRLTLDPGTGAGEVILSAAPPLIAPTNKLFVLHAEPAAPYLVETDPAFTNRRDFLASDYFLAQLERDPERWLKRYGDGYAEQRLVNDQVLTLTGRRFLSGYSDNEAQYRALMDAGVAYARDYQLTPGVALSAEHMALLSTDIVWLELDTVTLPNGTTESMLVPRVYLRRPAGGDVQDSGALIAGADVDIQTEQALVNRGTLAAQRTLTLTAGTDLINERGRLQGQTLLARAENDLKNLSGLIQGAGEGNDVRLSAGRDIVLDTLSQVANNASGTHTRETLDRIATVQGGTVRLDAARHITAQGAVVRADADLIAQAGGDIALNAAQTRYRLMMENSGGRSELGRTSHLREEDVSHRLSELAAGGNLALITAGDARLSGADLVAGQDLLVQGASVSIAPVTDRALRDSMSVGDQHYRRTLRANETVVGANLDAGRHLTVNASGGGETERDGDLMLSGAQLRADQGQVSLLAARDVSLQHLTTEQRSLAERYKKNSDLVSSRRTQSSDEVISSDVVGSVISGETVAVLAGRDLTAQGSHLVAERDLSLDAQNDLRLLDAESRHSETRQHQEKKRGLSAGGGRLSLGTQRAEDAAATQTRQSVISTIGSVSGNVSVSAGLDVMVQGVDFIAGGDLAISGRNVDMLAAIDSGEHSEAHQRRQGGLSLGVSSVLIDAGTRVQRSIERGHQGRAGRV